jgi:hypothetical protein
MYIDSLSREELDIVDTRFDLMSEDELSSYMESFGQALPPETPRPGGGGGGSTSPITPRAMPTRRLKISSGEGEDSGETSPLFPPSPPDREMRREMSVHPLRILARAVRELRENVERLEEENEILRVQVGTRRRSSGRPADEVSWMEGL